MKIVVSQTVGINPFSLYKVEKNLSCNLSYGKIEWISVFFGVSFCVRMMWLAETFSGMCKWQTESFRQALRKLYEWQSGAWGDLKNLVGVQKLRAHLSPLGAGNQCRPLLDLSALQDRKSGSWPKAPYLGCYGFVQNKRTDVVPVSFHRIVDCVFGIELLPDMRRANYKAAGQNCAAHLPICLVRHFEDSNSTSNNSSYRSM